MTDLEPRLTRRALLGAAALVAAGCTSRRRPAASDPDEADIGAARAGELALLASYAEGSADHDAHVAHLRALGGTPPSPGNAATPTGSPAYTDLRTSVAVLQAAARRARRGAAAATFASIAASHAVLAEPRP